MNKKFTAIIPILAGLVSIVSPISASASECSQASAGNGCYFTNVDDFSGNAFKHITFDEPDERTADDIVTKFRNLEDFTLSGYLKIRHTSEHILPQVGEGTEGGPVSGDYRIDWGYSVVSTVTLDFTNPVDSVGGFIGGNILDVELIVTFEDDTTYTISRVNAGLDGVQFGASECQAINGFLAIDSNGGNKIKSAQFRSAVFDSGSIDSIFYGDANGGVNGAGPTNFAESPHSEECESLGFVPIPELPVSPFEFPITHLEHTEVLGAFRLTPQETAPMPCAEASEGAMYYSFPSQMPMMCDGMNWKEYQGPKGDTGLTGPQGVPGNDSPFANLNCSTDQVARYNGTTWVCDEDISIYSLSCNEGDSIKFTAGTWACSNN